MQNITFVQIVRGYRQHYNDALELWVPYIEETNQHLGVVSMQTTIVDSLMKRINIQGTRDTMHFEILYCDGAPIGLRNYAVDGGIRGLIEPGYGVCMEFYIGPKYRRTGYGRKMYEHIEKTLLSHGVPYIYLCPDPVTGVPFWNAMGFDDSGMIDPDDKRPIFIKKSPTHRKDTQT